MQRSLSGITNTEAEQDGDPALFARIAADLEETGFSINPASLATSLVDSLHSHVVSMNEAKFSAAGVGRGGNFVRSQFVRTDEICWIEGDSPAGRNWLNWARALQKYLNEKLLLGLFSFESHFSHYGTGDYYKRHKDAFRGEANRVLSLVLYLNPGWTSEDGGELVIYKNDDDLDGIRVTPLLGSLVVFLSEEFPHEVLPAARDRYAIAGWYRVNSSVFDKVDPPL
ncbi:MAG: 2OG-Fe(II) oxygenase [Gammaproteobacteria bacterium]